jgi:hypothetical protein
MVLTAVFGLSVSAAILATPVSAQSAGQRVSRTVDLTGEWEFTAKLLNDVSTHDAEERRRDGIGQMRRDVTQESCRVPECPRLGRHTLRLPQP